MFFNKITKFSQFLKSFIFFLNILKGLKLADFSNFRTLKNYKSRFSLILLSVNEKIEIF